MISTLSIVIFGEIVPQSVCSRHPLAIGSACIPLVYLFVVLTFVVSYPTSLVLDYILGEDMGTIYSRNQLKGMLEMYANMKETDFGAEETNMMAGVVDFSNKAVGECMTHLREVQQCTYGFAFSLCQVVPSCLLVMMSVLHICRECCALRF